MAFGLFSRGVRVAGTFLVALIAACGGGGGNGEIPSSSAPAAVVSDTTGPTVLSAAPANGATNVAVDGAFAFKMSESVACEKAAATVNGVSAVVSCIGDAMTVKPKNALFYGEDASVTIAGYKDAAGNVGTAYTSKVTAVALPITGTKAYVLNANTTPSASSVIKVDAGNLQVQGSLPLANSYLVGTRLVTDSGTGNVYAAAGLSSALNAFNMVTEKALPSIAIALEQPALPIGIQGVAVGKGEVCLVTGLYARLAEDGYRNRLVCFDRRTIERTFVSSRLFLGDETMIPTGVIADPSRRVYFVALAKESALVIKSFMTIQGVAQSRPDFVSGTVGRVVEVDAMTHTLTGRAWNVGSAPMALAVVGNSLRVVNSGDTTLSVIDLQETDMTKVVTVDWNIWLSGFARATSYLPDVGKGVTYVTDYQGAVRVFDLVTHMQTGFIMTFAVPGEIALSGDRLYVTLPKTQIFDTNGDSVAIVNTLTQAVIATVKVTNSADRQMPTGVAVHTGGL